MNIKTEKPRWLARDHANFMFTWKLPFIPQWQGYQRSWHFSCPTCNNNIGAEWEEYKGIIGYSEDSFGDYIILHECPKCGTKWYNHLSHETDPELNRIMFEDMMFMAEEYGVGNPELLVKKEQVKDE